MGGDLTTACFYDQASGKVVAQTGYNRGKANVQLENTQQDMHDFQVPDCNLHCNASKYYDLQLT